MRDFHGIWVFKKFISDFVKSLFFEFLRGRAGRLLVLDSMFDVPNPAICISSLRKVSSHFDFLPSEMGPSDKTLFTCPIWVNLNPGHTFYIKDRSF